MLQEIVDKLVILAEDLYGNKIGNYPIKISEIKKGSKQPHIGIMENGDVEIFITDNAYNNFNKGDEVQAYNQIGHEVIHSLMQPQEQGNANYLEEGMAVYFSIYVLEYYGLINKVQEDEILDYLRLKEYKYYKALMLVCESGIKKEIKNIRINKPFLAKVEYDDLNNLVIEENFKRLLLTNFKEEIDF